MTAATGIDGEAAKKVLLGDGAGVESGARFAGADSPPRKRRLETDEENAADDLVKLVLALVETVRQLMERQAIRRVDSGALSDDETERLGLTLLRLEERMAELKEHFGMQEGDVSLRLGPVEDFAAVLEDEGAPGSTEGSVGRKT